MSIQTIVTSAVAASSSKPIRRMPSTFERMAHDAFSILAEFLSIPEAKKLELASKNIQVGIVSARAKFTYVHLSSPETDGELLAQKLAWLSRHFPRVDSLELNLADLTGAGFRVLAEAPQIRQLVRIVLYGGTRMNTRRSKRELSLLIESINFASLQVFDSARTRSLPTSLPELFANRLPSCKELKVVCLHSDLRPTSENRKFVDNLSLLGTLEELGPFLAVGGGASMFPFNDVFLDRFMENCINPQRIKKCRLNLLYEKDCKVSSQKLEQLLKFLPLSRMTHIHFDGPSMNERNLKELAGKLQDNVNLVQVQVSAPDVGLDAIVDLLKSIHSPELEELVISFSRALFTPADIPADVLQTLSSLPKLRKLAIGTTLVNLAQLRA